MIGTHEHAGEFKVVDRTAVEFRPASAELVSASRRYHAPADQSNRRTDLQDYAAWEIHPVMKLEVNGPSLLCRVGPVAFFMKPFDDEKFIAAVRDALNQSLIRK